MSTTVDPIVEETLREQASMDKERSCWEPLFQELKDLVRPDTADFSAGNTRAHDSRRKIYDGTAPWSLDQLASGLHSYVTSPVDRFFSIGVAGIPYHDLDFEAKAWLEEVADIIYAHYSNPFSSFNPAQHETYMDLGAFGTSCVYQWLDPSTQALMFRAFPLAQIRVRENNNGVVDVVHRRWDTWTVRNVRQEFGTLPKELAKMKDDDCVKIIHRVAPREDRKYGAYGPSNKAFKSCYVCETTKELLHEGGYDWMPYHTPRWAKIAGEAYGRSPALSVFPDIRMVNAMSKTVIAAANKMVDPPLMLPDDGFLLPLKQGPGGLNFYRPGTEGIQPLPTAQRIDIGVDQIEQRRDSIRRGFYVDWLVRPTKKERQTAQEIMDDRNQMLSMLGPVVGRLHGELVGPEIQLSFNLLNRAQLLPPMPGSLDGATLELVYISPAAKAQATTRGQGLSAYVGQVTQLLPVMPELMDSINVDSLNAELQDVTDVPRRVLNDPATTAQKKQAREQQQQQAMLAQTAPAVGKTAKDLASAQQIMGGGA